jgi:hypothetical protein
MYRHFGKYFQIRWREKLGKPECPYLIRYTLILFNYSLRLHHWIRSDDNRYLHDHAGNFISVVLWGEYYNHTENGIFHVIAPSWWRSNALTRHYLEIPAQKYGCWTLLLVGRPYNKWGFYVDGKKMRPKKYFKKFGVIQDKDYQ